MGGSGTVLQTVLALVIGPAMILYRRQVEARSVSWTGHGETEAAITRAMIVVVGLYLTWMGVMSLVALIQGLPQIRFA